MHICCKAQDLLTLQHSCHENCTDTRPLIVRWTPSSIRALCNGTQRVLPEAIFTLSGSGASACAKRSTWKSRSAWLKLQEWRHRENVGHDGDDWTKCRKHFQQLQLQEQRIAALEIELQIESIRAQTAWAREKRVWGREPAALGLKTSSKMKYQIRSSCVPSRGYQVSVPMIVDTSMSTLCSFIDFTFWNTSIIHSTLKLSLCTLRGLPCRGRSSPRLCDSIWLHHFNHTTIQSGSFSHAKVASRIAVILRCPRSVWRRLAALAFDMGNTFNACVSAKPSYLSYWLTSILTSLQRTKSRFSDGIAAIRTWIPSMASLFSPRRITLRCFATHLSRSHNFPV